MNKVFTLYERWLDFNIYSILEFKFLQVFVIRMVLYLYFKSL
jgi:hypothetical protein